MIFIIPSLTPFIIGELTAYDGFMNRPDEEVPEDEQWRSTRPVLATTYFNGLYEDLKSLNMLAMPLNPSLGVWEIWPAHGYNNGFQRWADVRYSALVSSLLNKCF